MPWASASRRIADAYSVEREEAVAPFPGALETLAYMADHGVALGLVTNGAAHTQRNKVNRLGLGRFFETILIEGELGYGKPDEAVYRKALSDLKLAPRDVWFVGDNLEWDVAAPQRLGIFAIWNDFKGEGLPPSSLVVPDRTIHQIAELAEQDCGRSGPI